MMNNPESSADRVPIHDEHKKLLEEAYFHLSGSDYERAAHVYDRAAAMSSDAPDFCHAFTMAAISYGLAGNYLSAEKRVNLAIFKAEHHDREEAHELLELQGKLFKICNRPPTDNTN